MTRPLIAATVLLTGAVLSAAPPRQAASAADVAARLQARQATIKSFTADYTQELQAKFLPQIQRGSGTFKVLKPDRLWMTQSKPDVTHFVADGQYVWDYDVANKYAVRSAMPKDATASTSMMFLTGRADLTRDFTSTLVPNAPTTEWHLVLTPKSATSEFTTLTMMVARDTLKLVGLITLDREGTKHSYHFTNLVENAPLQPAQFLLKLPTNVHIETR
jgi:outer membrane lipoprotein carrier protein